LWYAVSYNNYTAVRFILAMSTSDSPSSLLATSFCPPSSSLTINLTQFLSICKRDSGLALIPLLFEWRGFVTLLKANGSQQPLAISSTHAKLVDIFRACKK